jgi:hypothetical protein
MFSFFSNLSNPFHYPWRTDNGKNTIDLKSVLIHDIENPSSHDDDDNNKSSQALKHLVKLNHIESSILFHQNQFHNHMPHVGF